MITAKSSPPFPFKKYRPYQFAPPHFKRSWPSVATHESRFARKPTWCAVDLRDGNQALPIPMSVREKLQMFNLLASMGFTQIETGFPSASDIEFKTHRKLIEQGLIGGKIVPQVLCQARPELIAKTFEAMKGCRKWIFHLYNSTSVDQREFVFGKTKKEIIDIALGGVAAIKKHAEACGEEVQLQYSPESFTGTEPEFAAEICIAVFKAWAPKRGQKMIINLPATVEHTTPNVYADQIEWMIQQFEKAGIRDQVIVSLHTHNDRGTGIAATELGLLAGADRVEGTLFGNGERTGNVDIMALALNMASHGINPRIDVFDVPRIAKAYERLTRLTIPARAQYAGEFTFVAFSGSHQDAIDKGLAAYKKAKATKKIVPWRVPYLAIDPADIGRDYKAIIRVNSQSGKGGAVAILKRDFHLTFPIKAMHVAVGKCAKAITTKGHKEISSRELLDVVAKTMANTKTPLSISEFRVIDSGSVSSTHSVAIKNSINGQTTRVKLTSQQGQVDTILHAVNKATGMQFDVVELKDESLSRGGKAQAASYIAVKNRTSGEITYGLGISTDSSKAARSALIAACNQHLGVESVMRKRVVEK